MNTLPRKSNFPSPLIVLRVVAAFPLVLVFLLLQRHHDHVVGYYNNSPYRGILPLLSMHKKSYVAWSSVLASAYSFAELCTLLAKFYISREQTINQSRVKKLFQFNVLSGDIRDHPYVTSAKIWDFLNLSPCPHLGLIYIHATSLTTSSFGLTPPPPSVRTSYMDAP